MGEIIPKPVPPVAMPLTGERLTSDYGGQTEIEHIHRYLLAREWCRGKDVVDVASGEGYGTSMLGQVARSAIGVEIAPDAVAHAARSYARDNLRYVQGDARAIPLPDACADVVVSFETIEHFFEQEQFLDEVRRILRPGGLVIVSTPDRDNYSPAEQPANPYHVREMTAPEFDTLVRSRFPHVSTLLQRPMFGSVLLPTEAGAAMPMSFERRGAAHIEGSSGLARAQYIVAFASDRPIEALPSSVYIETSRLGMLTPAEYEAQLQAARNEIASGHASLRAELTAAQNEAKALQIAAQNEAKALQIAAQNEAKALQISAEMAERSAHALRDDAQQARHALARTEQALAYAEARLAGTLTSHSWRLTAPVRWLSTKLYRR